MKILYKTVFWDEFAEYPETEKKQTFCCDDLRLAVESSNNTIHLYGSRVSLTTSVDEYYGNNESSIRFCPFCGEKFEFVETKKVKRISKTRIVPARKESYTSDIVIRRKNRA